MTITQLNHRRPSAASSILHQAISGRPRFVVLMILFICTSTIVVGVLGWQLTLRSAQSNIHNLVVDMVLCGGGDILSGGINLFVDKLQQAVEGGEKRYI
ncbi:hypothetical protein BCR33DRAFT_234827 [Rhizoclosmatium globosum]|uniref:Uncharacterized protein n=1 Tax=Rhizoclosmatium globosum TaxID=329046 RepID=A0A1Y2CAM5_9FUNG|nr:hypothetical protein BCR33DRAFT_234827 [Rhizoclosmatium globosum]|eukprot:ORY44082.1 hypothetical protein BCR33DRAFT_234827 [Rhizoclosmatium globosum]